MIYHLLVNLPASLPGIERAAITRHQLIKKNYPSKLVTVSYNRNLFATAQQYQLTPDDYLNLHDYFQQATEPLAFEPVKKEELFPESDYELVVVPNTREQDYRVFREKKLVAYIHTEQPSGRLVYINYFDKNIDKRERHLYDCRGFLSAIQYLDEHQREMFEKFLTPSGQTVIEKTYSLKSSERELTQVKVYTKRRPLFFESEADFMTYFFDQVLTEEDVTITDRNRFINPIILNCQTPFKKIGVLHSTHYQGDDPANELKSHYRVLLNERERFSTIICSTRQQRKDVIARFSNDGQVKSIPVAIRKEVPPNQLSFTDDQPIKIAMIARYSPEKRLDQGIKAFANISAKYPNAQLHLYGFGSAKNQQALEAVIAEAGVTDKVFLRGYLTDLDQELQSVHLKLLTSHEEGFCIGVLDALAHGIPVLSYDINYGPSEMITSGKNGYLVEDGQIDQLSERLDHVLSDPELYQQLSKAAYQMATEFSTEQVQAKWRAVFESLSVTPTIKTSPRISLRKRLSLFRR